MKKIFLPLLLSISLFGGVCDNFEQNFQDTKDLNKANVHCFLHIMEREMSKMLPMQLDQYTYITKVYAVDKEVMYEYMVHKISGVDNLKSLETEMKKVVTNSNCTNPDIKFIFPLGASIQHSYFTEDGKFLFRFSVSQKECAKIK